MPSQTGGAAAIGCFEARTGPSADAEAAEGGRRTQGIVVYAGRTAAGTARLEESDLMVGADGDTDSA